MGYGLAYPSSNPVVRTLYDFVFDRIFYVYHHQKVSKNFFKTNSAVRNTLNSRKTLDNLSSRYQLFENIRTTRFVAPNILAYCITLVVHIILLMYANQTIFDSSIAFAVAKVS